MLHYDIMHDLIVHIIKMPILLVQPYELPIWYQTITNVNYEKIVVCINDIYIYILYEDMNIHCISPALYI